jgi:hypothetical protein
MSTMFEVTICDLKHCLQGLQNTFTTWRTKVQGQARGGMEPDDPLRSRNAPGFVCLIGWSFWSVWFFWMNFRSDQPDRRDRPAFVGRAHDGNPPGHPKKTAAATAGKHSRSLCFSQSYRWRLRRSGFERLPSQSRSQHPLSTKPARILALKS